MLLFDCIKKEVGAFCDEYVPKGDPDVMLFDGRRFFRVSFILSPHRYADIVALLLEGIMMLRLHIKEKQEDHGAFRDFLFEEKDFKGYYSRIVYIEGEYYGVVVIYDKMSGDTCISLECMR